MIFPNADRDKAATDRRCRLLAASPSGAARRDAHSLVESGGDGEHAPSLQRSPHRLALLIPRDRRHGPQARLHHANLSATPPPRRSCSPSASRAFPAAATRHFLPKDTAGPTCAISRLGHKTATHGRRRPSPPQSPSLRAPGHGDFHPRVPRHWPISEPAGLPPSIFSVRRTPCGHTPRSSPTAAPSPFRQILRGELAAGQEGQRPCRAPTPEPSDIDTISTPPTQGDCPCPPMT